jgi:hypothetical protein
MAGKKAKAASQQASQVEDVLRALQKVPADVQGAKQRLQALLKDNQQNFLVHRLLVGAQDLAVIACCRTQTAG